MTTNKNLLIDAIIGMPFSFWKWEEQFRNHNPIETLYRFTGDQHNASWAWERHALERLHPRELEFVYSFRGYGYDNLK